MSEIWKPVVGLETRYEVSNLGRVRSLMSNAGPRKTPTMLKLQKHPDSGYWQVNFKVKGVATRPYVAHLVLEAFVGPRPAGKECCHDNGNVDDNTIGNLRWDTHIANLADKKLHGTDGVGERNSMAKLTNDQVMEIRRRYSTGDSYRKIADDMALTYSCVYSVGTGARWKVAE